MGTMQVGGWACGVGWADAESGGSKGRESSLVDELLPCLRWFGVTNDDVVNFVLEANGHHVPGAECA